MLFVNKENPDVFYFEEKMLTDEIQDGCEDPFKPRNLGREAKRPEFLVILKKAFLYEIDLVL